MNIQRVDLAFNAYEFIHSIGRETSPTLIAYAGITTFTLLGCYSFRTRQESLAQVTMQVGKNLLPISVFLVPLAKYWYASAESSNPLLSVLGNLAPMYAAAGCFAIYLKSQHHLLNRRNHLHRI